MNDARVKDLLDVAVGQAPVARYDLDAAVRSGRRRRAARTAATVATLTTVVALVAAGTLTLANQGRSTESNVVAATRPPAPSAEPLTPTAIPTTSADGPITTGPGVHVYPSPPADLVAVTLPEPAPGFAYNQMPGSPFGLTALDNSSSYYWGASFQVGTWPAGKAKGPGTFQSVNIDVSHSPLPPLTAAGTIDGAKVTGTVPVAGVTGHLTTWTEKGATYHNLYFATARFSVRLIGTEGVTTTQLVLLAESLTGIR